MTKKTIEDYHELAKSIGWTFDESSYTGLATDKVIWHCQDGHKVEKSRVWVIRTPKCLECEYENRIGRDVSKKTKKDYLELAKRRRLTWLGDEIPQNTTFPTRWEGKCGHEWNATFSDISKGSGCGLCAGNIRKDESHYHKLADQYGFKWVGEEIISVKTKTKWECPNGHVFEKEYRHFKQSPSCPLCPKTSQVEVVIIQFLEKHGIPYEYQKSFPTCRNKLPLPFDFYINNYLLIEIDGPQHFEPVNFWNRNEESALKDFQSRQKHDKIKNKWAKQNKIPLERIPYYKKTATKKNLIKELTRVLTEYGFL